MHKNGKPTILLMSDDFRMNSGISTIARELIMGTAHHYNWINIGGAINHPENGKCVDVSQFINQHLKREDCYVKIYPVNGYGNDQIVFAILDIEKPDVVLHFTDPRYWEFLYAIERQIRQKIPLTYLNIWDDLPWPQWNRPFYESCDTLFAITKQTYNINKWVLRPEHCFTLDGEFDKNGNIIKK